VQYTKKELLKWINSNIFNAKFNSMATMWIRAYILIEIDNNSRIVKKPKSEIYRDREKNGAYKKEVTLDIDAPIASDTDTVFGDLLKMEDGTLSDLEVAEAYDTYKFGLNKLLEGVKPRDRAIFLKKFGIGLPRPMLPKEIADQEGLSIARISQIFQTVVEQIQYNQVKYDIDPNILFDAVKKFR
jgi:DNA-directed RNA polymerase sigma subunit (sigma70/sigma32)